MRNLRAILLLLLFVAFFFPLRAYDFKKTIGNNTLYFTIQQSGNGAKRTVSVVAPGSDNDSYGQLAKPQGRLTIPSEVQYDGEYYFVTSIGHNAFAGCENLNAVSLPSSLREIGEGAFIECKSLYSITFNCDSMLYVGNAFSGCTAVDTIVIGASVKLMPAFSFLSLPNFKVVIFLAENPTSLQNLFFDCTADATLIVGDRVSQLPPFLCYNFVGLKSLEFVGDGHCLASVGKCAFVNCSSLRRVDLPPSVTYIGDNAFSYCNLQSFVFRSELPPVVTGNSFYGVDKSTPITIPCGSRGAYANSSLGRYFEQFVYPKGCPTDPIMPEVVYIHDTVWIHDTVYKYIADVIENDGAPQEVAQLDVSDIVDESDPENWIFLSGKILRITKARKLAGVRIRIYDNDGRLVIDERIPADQPADNYYVRLPRRARYFLNIGNAAPISVDVINQKVGKK